VLNGAFPKLWISVAFDPADSDAAWDSSYSLTITIFVLARAAQRGCRIRTCALCFRRFLVETKVVLGCWLASVSVAVNPPSVDVSLGSDGSFAASGSWWFWDCRSRFSLLKYHSRMYLTKPWVRIWMAKTLRIHPCELFLSNERIVDSREPLTPDGRNLEPNTELSDEKLDHLEYRVQWEKPTIRTQRTILFAVPCLEVPPPPRVKDMTTWARSKINCCIGAHKNTHIPSMMTSIQSNVVRDGVPWFPSKISVMLRPELVVTGGTKVRKVKSM
jgi:hypothetical protein